MPKYSALENTLEDTLTYLEQLKNDLEKEKTKLMDIYIDIHEHQKNVSAHIDSLNDVLNSCDEMLVQYDGTEEIVKIKQ